MFFRSSEDHPSAPSNSFRSSRPAGDCKFGDPKVAQKRIAIFIEEDVRRLNVAVQKAPGVHKVKRLGHVRQPILQRVGRLVAEAGTRSLPSRSQTTTRQKLHHRERLPSLFGEIDDLDDVGVAQLYERTGFSRKRAVGSGSWALACGILTTTSVWRLASQAR